MNEDRRDDKRGARDPAADDVPLRRRAGDRRKHDRRNRERRLDERRMSGIGEVIEERRASDRRLQRRRELEKRRALARRMDSRSSPSAPPRGGGKPT